MVSSPNPCTSIVSQVMKFRRSVPPSGIVKRCRSDKLFGFATRDLVVVFTVCSAIFFSFANVCSIPFPASCLERHYSWQERRIVHFHNTLLVTTVDRRVSMYFT